MNVRGLDLPGKWSPEEVRELRAMLEPIPRAWIEQNPHVKSIIRRSVIRNAPPEAPGHSKYQPAFAAIVVFDKGVYHDGQIDPEQFRRSVYHELGHAILKNEPALLDSWSERTGGDRFVDRYAKSSPEEDFCDTFSEFFIHNEKTHKVVPIKARFMQGLLERAQREKVAMHFINGFGDELLKMARPSVGRLARMLGRGAAKGGRTPGKMSVGKGLALAGGAGIVGAEAGRRKGRKKGYQRGAGDVMQVAQKARMIGRREGVLAYHRALMQHRRRAAGGK